MKPNSEVSTVIDIAQHAADIVLSHFQKKLDVSTKNNDAFNFLTQADTEADAYISTALRKAFPGDAILTEEGDTRPASHQGRVWMVDPLDGTKEFINGGSRFSTMIGLCTDGVPVLGVVMSPTEGTTYWASKGHGAYATDKSGHTAKLRVGRPRSYNRARILTPILYGEPRPAVEFLEGKVAPGHVIHDSSFGLLAAMIATGHGEFFANTNVRASKWDICAPQVILEEAGGTVTDVFGRPLDYLSTEQRWPASFVGTGGVDHAEVIQAISGIEKFVTD
jgi:3'(2'), 5'-bisphosphate nucleotidase